MKIKNKMNKNVFTVSMDVANQCWHVEMGYGVTGIASCLNNYSNNNYSNMLVQMLSHFPMNTAGSSEII